MADEEDEDLERAIALSLAQSGLPDNNVQTIDLESETEDEQDDELKRAIAMSLGERNANGVETNVLHEKGSDGKVDSVYKHPLRTDGTKTTSLGSVTSISVNDGIAGLDRKAMEQERLSRIAARKRQAPISPPQVRRVEERPEKKAKVSFQSKGPGTSPFTTEFAKGETLQHPRGVIYKTWSKAHPNAGGIKFEDVIQKNELRTALFSSFQWDSEWFFSKVDMRRTKMVLAMQAKSEQEREERRLEQMDAGFKNVKLCFPPMNGGYTCMHSKLMLLFYEESLRVVVPTANLTEYDWGETGVMENSVFMIDLPRRKNGSQGGKKDLTFFGRELMYFLEKMELQEDMRNGVMNFDFSDTSHLAFIHSIFGPQHGDDIPRTGYHGLGTAIKQLGLQTSKTLELVYATSSLGSLNDLTINNIYEAARGTDRSQRDPKLLKASNENTKNSFHIYFPTHETVARSLGGPNNAGTIWLDAKHYHKPDFPKSCLRDYQSLRKGLLSHNKLLFARGESKDGSRQVSWVYIGSANLSESAWGRLVVDRTKKVNKLTCNNWECGVLVPMGATSDERETKSVIRSSKLGEAFEGLLEIPFVEPGDKFGDRLPWFLKGHGN
ncbi:phospholipase D/nuclease [Tothia fuscella]|uniref:Phospholipase D/nuclease n=1 Tax=Tothia fuscella TaxID=1048955 RepID=A0A9P4NKM0_9PEZI|nr:phospholipase D/nuclease [Tothia fuscella]